MDDAQAADKTTAGRRGAGAQESGNPTGGNRAGKAATPMMAQYLTIKQDYPDCLLFYRMGDFYELFFDDAVRAAEALDITLTTRGQHEGKPVPMAGVPVHSAESYLARLIRKNFKVAVCEQTEDPEQAKKRGSKALVRREVVRLVTAGTLTEETLLDARRNNYLAALGRARDEVALAWTDMSTGDLFTMATSQQRLAAEVARIAPQELLIGESFQAMAADLLGDLQSNNGTDLTLRAPAEFDSTKGEQRLKEMFAISALDAFGNFGRAELAAVAALLSYLDDTQKGQRPYLKPPQRLEPEAVMLIDAATRRNLELTRTLDGAARGSLLSVIDRTVTGAGARALADRLAAPLTDPARINARLDAVEYLLEATDLRFNLRKDLRACPDLERAVSRISLGRGGPRDLAQIRDALGTTARLKDHLFNEDGGLDGLPEDLQACAAGLGEHSALVDQLTRALVADAPVLAREGGFIAKGYDASLDEFRTLRDESRRLIAGLEARYRDETAISGLKIRHNNVLGYHIDVSAKQADKLLAPPLSEVFIHRQTLANNVRFTTGELADLAAKISEAGDRALALEQQIFDSLVEAVLAQAETLGQAAQAIAAVDVAAALAELAADSDYRRPHIDASTDFAVTGGRHPVVEAALAETGQGPFIANDCDLGQDHRLWLLTGPNMAGKSTFLRQNALIAILAQMGAFVPAKAARIGIVDRLFSRIGASDDLSAGRSTFMVEMVETAAILNQATDRSLVILDEIGRGTATYDGLSIAWAAVEHLHDVNKARALFATHYHELAALKESLPALALRSMRVKKWEGEVVFLHEVAGGAADRSYGIQVAKLAGLPAPVVERAREVLALLEGPGDEDKAAILAQDLPLFQPQAEPSPPPMANSPVIDTLQEVVADDLTPKEALDLIYHLKSLLNA